MPDKPPACRNVFQDLDDSMALWKAALHWGCEDLLSPDDLWALRRYVQQRHLLSHNDGLLDLLYFDRAGESSYQLGQRLVIRSESVDELAELASGHAKAIRNRYPMPNQCFQQACTTLSYSERAWRKAQTHQVQRAAVAAGAVEIYSF